MIILRVFIFIQTKYKLKRESYNNNRCFLIVSYYLIYSSVKTEIAFIFFSV